MMAYFSLLYSKFLIGRLLLLLSLALPFIFAWLLLVIWRAYKRVEYVKNIEWVLLEIKIPREINKTPQAMEVILSALHETGDGNWYEHLNEGVLRPWFSLELVSISGKVHFYLRAKKSFKNLIEAQIYSQYPGVEIVEAEDYTLNVPYGKPGNDLDLSGFILSLVKPDPYPIKTYIDYGLDKSQEEEEKVDPMTPVLELLGSMKPGEQMWFQILIMATKSRFTKKGTWFEKIDWTKQAKEIIDEKMKKTIGPDGKDVNKLSPGDKIEIEAIQRSVGKLGFDCGIRAIYLSPKDLYDKANASAMSGVLKQFNSSNLNGFKPVNGTKIKYPWQDLSGKKLAKLKIDMFNAFRQRAYFYSSYFFSPQPFILNTEELATIYHLPGSVANTPTLSRIESQRGEPPANLPI